ncbi:hypothetical protein LBMAG56_12720 [Verrucomicrobiota bacterium]|nr:hypothetical protein LBMAG56_12720 [Verrucomicrobiota bacterium]
MARNTGLSPNAAMNPRRPLWSVVFLLVLACALGASALRADHDQVPGHSQHGDAFNEGPRQEAHLMPGMGAVHFPITTKAPLGQKFFDQGIGQLHGFFYFEAERSFRQVAALDAACPMAFWGMAMANPNNQKRAKEFIKSAEKLRANAGAREQQWIAALADLLRDDKKGEKREEKDRRKAYNQALEKIVKDHPDDLEAKALLAVQLWQSSGKGVGADDKKDVDKLLDAVLAANRFHPVNHYRIHLWDDGARATNALVSAANCGPSAPGIAHMWHMSGHTYSALKRYADAAWQQEASARVDHAYMMSNRVLPDQIHNFAHNNEWLIRDLNNIGAVRRAVELAKNMIELPRHPKHNTLTRGSSAYGYQRLLETLVRYELWEELLALSGSVYLQPTDNNDHEARRFHALGLATLNTGDLAGGKRQIAALEALAVKVATKPAPSTNAPASKPGATNNAAAVKPTATNAPAAKPVLTNASGALPAVSAPTKAPTATPATVPATAQTNLIEQAARAILTTNVVAVAPVRPAPAVTATNATAKTATTNGSATNSAAAAKDSPKPAPKKNAPGSLSSGAFQLATGNTNAISAAVAELRCLLALKDGKVAEAKEQLPKLKEVPRDRLARMHFAAGDKGKAEEFAKEAMNVGERLVQPLASYVDLAYQNRHFAEAFAAFFKLRELAAEADLTAPVFRRLAPVVKELELEADWRPPLSRAADFGLRPSLESLGPFRWQPSAAPDWTLSDGEGKPVSLRDYRGKPVVVVFYLGAGCAHCIEQLVAFAPMVEEFKAAGVALVAVSTDSVAGLRETGEKAKYNGGFPIPLASDHTLATFKSYRVHDDFEAKPLHGTFLIDGDGLIRWQDISYQPFMETKFLLGEAKRLLGLPKSHGAPAPTKLAAQPTEGTVAGNAR